MSTETFHWLMLLCAWFAVFGIGAAILGIVEWVNRHKVDR